MAYKVIYKHEDGTEFESEAAVIAYSNKKSHDISKLVAQYKKTYRFSELMKNYSLTEMGIWEIYGEDPNCEFSGYHHEPHLETVSGTLDDTIRYAVGLPNFWQWGSGGRIKHAKEVKIL